MQLVQKGWIMAEGTYEYEVMRAELLGIEKPDYDEFLKRQKEKEQGEIETEEIDTENLKVCFCIFLNFYNKNFLLL